MINLNPHARFAWCAALALFMTTGCATSKQMKETQTQLDSMSAQLEILVENTRRDVLTQLFGDQSEAIVSKLDEMEAGDRDDFEAMLSEYQKGESTLEDVRTGMMTMLGGGERIVASSTGIWIRDMEGVKLDAISRGTELAGCRRLEDSELPATISEKEVLTRYDWGTGEVEGQQVIFPWDFTMSTFTKEIVENTAKRTAEEFMRMSGDGSLNRPIQIQVVTDPNSDAVKISYPTETGEIILTDDKGNQVPTETKPGTPQ